MAVRFLLLRFAAIPALLCGLAGAQQPIDQPLPDVAALMHDVEANQHQAEAIEKDYIYHSVITQQQLDSHGGLKKTSVIDADNYWQDGIPVTRLTSKDGKALDAKSAEKQDRQIEKDVAKAKERRAKAAAEGKPTDPRGEDLVTVSRLLELGAFTHPRRVPFAGRDTIAVDFTGDSRAKTHNRMETVIRDMAGTAWIDEQDRMIVRIEGRFVDNFKVGGGLLANIRKGTHFTAQMTKINGEVWLPAEINAEGAARFLLFWNFDGRVEIRFSDYRKFRTSSTVLPAASQ